MATTVLARSLFALDRLVDAREAYADGESKQAAREKLLDQLIPPNRDRFKQLDTKLHQVSEFYREFARGDVIADDNRANLKTLEDVYLRLLVARQHLSSSNAEADEQKIREQILRLETRLKDPASSLSAAARESKRATLELLEKRLAVFAKRDEAIEEIDADLTWIETQFELAADSAAIRAKPSEAKLDLDLASRMMSTPEYLDLGSSSDVAQEPMTVAWESA